MTYVAAAYLAVMLLVTAYVWSLWARHRELQALLPSRDDAPLAGGTPRAP